MDASASSTSSSTDTAATASSTPTTSNANAADTPAGTPPPKVANLLTKYMTPASATARTIQINLNRMDSFTVSVSFGTIDHDSFQPSTPPLTLEARLLPYPSYRPSTTTVGNSVGDNATAAVVAPPATTTISTTPTITTTVPVFSWNEKIVSFAEADVILPIQGLNKEDDFDELLRGAAESSAQIILTSSRHVNYVQCLEKNFSIISQLKTPIIFIDRLDEKLPEATQNSAVRVVIVDKSKATIKQCTLQEAEEREIFS